jgi:Putative beta barrel porin-7 (BBP7)
MRLLAALVLLTIGAPFTLAQTSPAAVDAPVAGSSRPAPLREEPVVQNLNPPGEAWEDDSPKPSWLTGFAHLEVDYLWWYLERMRVPTLATTGPIGSPAILGEPGTSILYGDDRLTSRHGRYVGLEAKADIWLNTEETLGLNGSAFFLERDSSNITYGWNTISPLARPYIDANDGSQKTLIVAGNVPGLGNLVGSFNAYSRIEFFGEDLNGEWVLGRTENCQLSALLGGRFLQMRERLDLTGTSKLLPVESTLYGVTDHFHTFDKFYGAQFGLHGEMKLFDRLSLSAKATFAMGADGQEIKTYGDRVIAVPGDRQTLNYGLLVQPSNSGTFDRAAFDMVSEVSLTLRYQVTRRVSLRAGYSFMTWNNPVRPGDQIVPVNPTQVGSGLSGSAHPTVPFREDFFWAQGGNVGLEVSW